MINGRPVLPLQHFGTILNFLRDGECDVPAHPKERRELLREAEAFEARPPFIYHSMQDATAVSMRLSMGHL